MLASFEFLRPYGLKPAEENATLVRYESDTVTVNVYHGRASYEIGVEIGRRDRPERYGLGYLVSSAGNDAWEAEGFGRSTMFQVSTPEGVRKLVPKVAELVRKYGDRFLSGDPAFYAQLADANERAGMAYERQQMLKRIRKDAEAAWDAKDFARVAELYDPISDGLTEIEIRKLAYARKRVHRPGDTDCPTTVPKQRPA